MCSMKRKYCIFHVPNYIDKEGKSGSQVRPLKMLQAFRNIGYTVDYVMGYGKERRKQIKQIKKNIENGRKYDFCYSESSTMPTVLTEKKHLPIYFGLDFNFLQYCKEHKIKIGLFYRDIRWKFESYKSAVPWYKRFISIIMYKYDLKKYHEIVDVLYLPSEQMKKELRKYKLPPIDILPPGATKDEEIIKQREKYFLTRSNNMLKIFYAGGISGIYDMTGIFRAVQKSENVYMTVCCRINEWEEMKTRYQPYLSERVKIVHESGEDLKKYYLSSDICSCYFPVSKYMQFAVPIKLFEYTGYVTPIIATRGTEAGRLLEQSKNGFVIEYKEESIVELLKHLQEQSELLLEKHKVATEYLEKNTWEQRAYKVRRDLKGE